MKHVKGNIWDFHSKGEWITITTNGFVKNSGQAVLGRGTALQAKTKYPTLPRELGQSIVKHGNLVYKFPKYKIVTFPVKHNWWEEADLELIEFSVNQLKRLWVVNQPLYMVEPGTGNGKLEWSQVEPLVNTLDDRFIMVHYDK